MAAWFRPEVLAAYGWMWANNALKLALWYFDMLFSFVIAFAVVYGLFSFSEKLFPPRLGRRPGVWAVPSLFAGVALAFPLFGDRFVSTVVLSATSEGIMALMRWFPGFPGEAVSQGIITIATVAAGVWSAGFAVMAFRALRGFAELGKAAARLPDHPDTPLLRAALAAACPGISVDVKIGPPDSPIVSCGLWRRRVIVPENFADRYSPEERHAILVHECIHGKNRDALRLFCLSLVKAVLWFDPVAGHAVKRMKNDMELLCDWTAVNACRIAPPAYAALIVKAMAERSRSAPGFSDTYRAVTRRLSHILREPDLRPPARLSRAGALVLSIGLASLLVAAVVFYAGIPPADPLLQDSLPVEDGMEIIHQAKRDGVFGQYAFVKVGEKRRMADGQ